MDMDMDMDMDVVLQPCCFWSEEERRRAGKPGGDGWERTAFCKKSFYY
jgi:hypothetical protein